MNCKQSEQRPFLERLGQLSMASMLIILLTSRFSWASGADYLENSAFGNKSESKGDGPSGRMLKKEQLQDLDQTVNYLSREVRPAYRLHSIDVDVAKQRILRGMGVLKKLQSSEDRQYDSRAMLEAALLDFAIKNHLLGPSSHLGQEGYDTVLKQFKKKPQLWLAFSQDYQPKKKKFDQEYMRDFVDLQWALYHLAIVTGQHHEEGAMVVEDPKNKLAKFLMKAPNASSRLSTHLKEDTRDLREYMQAKGGKNAGKEDYQFLKNFGMDSGPNMERGIDTVGHLDSQREFVYDAGKNIKTATPLQVLPGKKGTAMVIPLLNEKTGFGKNMVYLKWEEHGLNTRRGWLGHLGTTITYARKKYIFQTAAEKQREKYEMTERVDSKVKKYFHQFRDQVLANRKAALMLNLRWYQKATPTQKKQMKDLKSLKKEFDDAANRGAARMVKFLDQLKAGGSKSAARLGLDAPALDHLELGTMKENLKNKIVNDTRPANAYGQILDAIQASRTLKGTLKSKAPVQKNVTQAIRMEEYLDSKKSNGNKSVMIDALKKWKEIAQELNLGNNKDFDIINKRIKQFESTPEIDNIDTRIGNEVFLSEKDLDALASASTFEPEMDPCENHLETKFFGRPTDPGPSNSPKLNAITGCTDALDPFLDVKKGLTHSTNLLSQISTNENKSKQDQSEFPNYFMELVSKSPESSGESHAEGLIEDVLSSLLRRLQIPYVGENGTISTQGFFETLVSRVKASDPRAEVYAAGGVVRSLLGYIYKTVYTAKQRDPHKKVEDILQGMKDSEKPVLGLEALGIGSDLDILIAHSDGSEVSKTVINQAVTFINSSESKLALRDTESKLKYSIVPIGDVKDYKKQMDRTVSQGGSTLDWLSFPLSGGKMKMPQGQLKILTNFIHGFYDYLPPSELVEDLDKQTIRGLRPMWESPFLAPSPSGKKQLMRELARLVENSKRGRNISLAATEQFNKLSRNARFGGAHNRAYRKVGKDRDIEDLVLELIKAESKSNRYNIDNKRPIIPEFVENKSAKSREDQDRCDLRENKVLMSSTDFISKYTDHGKLYHGTPDLDNILPIIRNGFILSKDESNDLFFEKTLLKQGVASFGRGTYMTKDISVAQGYGVALVFNLKAKISPRVINWPEVRNKPQILKLLDQARLEEVDPFKYLADHCDIDVIINEHVLIQNSGVLQTPKLEDLINTYRDKIRIIKETEEKAEQKADFSGLGKAISDYQRLHEFGVSMGMKNLKAPPSLMDVLTESNEKLRKAALPYFVTTQDQSSIKKMLENKWLQSAEVKDALVSRVRDLLAPIIEDSSYHFGMPPSVLHSERQRESRYKEIAREIAIKIEPEIQVSKGFPQFAHSFGFEDFTLPTLGDALKRFDSIYETKTGLPMSDRIMIEIMQTSVSDEELRKYLIDNDVVTHQLAIRAGDWEMMYKLGNKGLERLDSEGNSPLHVAIIKCYSTAVEYLLENKVQLDFKDKQGRSYLELAVKFCGDRWESGVTKMLEDTNFWK